MYYEERNGKVTTQQMCSLVIMLPAFFEFLMNIPTTQSSYLVMGSNRYISDNGYFQYKAKQAYNLALEAIEADQNKYYWTRNERFRSIFGTRFPSNT